ncbi:MAG: hypothetical protein ACLFOY_11325 [Desulfatibacillaceae bacterium]
MADKIKICMNWAAACGGCDVSLLDIEEKLLDVVEIADVVYWPVAMDFKRDDLEAMEPDSIDIGLFNGSVRTTEQAEDAVLLRKRCKVLIAYGVCATHGGIPGLANVSDKQGVFDVAYQDTASTENPDGHRPEEKVTVGGMELTLPGFHDSVYALDQVVDVDYYLPGCPPTPERILDAVGVIAAYAQGGDLPPKGATIADDKALCDTCPRRDSRVAKKVATVTRPHLVVADQDRCFLDQGIPCMGPVTAGGCGASCVNVNMPCRGCFGPAPTVRDMGAEAATAFGSIFGPDGEDNIPAGKMKSAVNAIADPLGTFYRFTFPSAIAHRCVKEEKK